MNNFKYYAIIHSEHYNYCHELRSNNLKHLRKYSYRFARIGCLNVIFKIFVDIYKSDSLISSSAVVYNRKRRTFYYYTLS